MKFRVLLGVMVASAVVCGCGSSAAVSGGSQPVQQKPSSTGVVSYKPEIAYVQPVVDESKYAPAKDLAARMQKSPSTLSREEYYLVASLYRPGSKEFVNVYDNMLRYYPNDETANLNKGNSKMDSGDVPNARYFLDKAGNSAAAEYARGVWYSLRGNFKQAMAHFTKAEQMGFPQATNAVRSLAGART